MRLIHAIMKKGAFYRKVDGEIVSESSARYKIKQTGIGAIISVQKIDIEKVTMYTPPPPAIQVWI